MPAGTRGGLGRRRGAVTLGTALGPGLALLPQPVRILRSQVWGDGPAAPDGRLRPDGAGGREHAGPGPGRADSEPAPADHRHSPRGDRQRHRRVAGSEVLRLGGGGPASGRPPGAARLHIPAARAPQPRAQARRDALQVPAIYLTKKNIRNEGALVDHEKEHYDQLHKKINHMWDLVVMQAQEQLRAAKQRRKGDRLVTARQEHTYWLVNRPPPGAPNVLEQGPERSSYTASRVQMSSDFYKQEIEFSRKALGRTRVKSSICLEGYLKFSNQHSPHDHIMSGCLPSNPWITDDDTYWVMNAPMVAVPTKLRVERWGFSFRELLDDPVGRAHFMDFLQKEFSGEKPPSPVLGSWHLAGSLGLAQDLSCQPVKMPSWLLLRVGR
ncbi:regulator of G-protein signaling 11 isoform X1 [Heterocephalus glaber]|uniref:Regulator of G-protein signaling 11 isoform X1 n=1 Tax=Heterocephalus glaber TaxID=10181 RepID=A0AAX6SCC5_HETGA|nr:regulator of G-protein signaling 11 isoform X1 [Heterocephalus glaber]